MEEGWPAQDTRRRALDEGADIGEGFRLAALAVLNACVTGSSSLDSEETDCHTSPPLGRSLLLR